MILKTLEVAELTMVPVMTHGESQPLHRVNQILVRDSPLPHIVHVSPRAVVLWVDLVGSLNQVLVMRAFSIHGHVSEILIKSEIKKSHRFL